MSYQVLARKWRPRTFHELVGQEHVQRALVNALDQGRLHHAYLFTGTRGVGKTTLARILAKCLNCETGVTSNPCGRCETCRAIDEGRFVDLIEVDAASRTKVEDTRELLDNVQYAPTQGRYKVYLIDEVHMLSTHSFNALLKTLEEPPPHVKFLLATTDPQKLPVTILSRCLQFSLKHMPPERVVEHLTRVLTAEEVPFDERALWLLGKAANGSMRDALSLTDQAIAFGQGEVQGDDVAAMLGTLDHRHLLSLATALAESDASRVLAEVASLAEQGPDFSGVLDELSGVFHRLAIAQMVPGALDNGFGDRDELLALASRFTAEDVQLYYQIALQGRSDMEHAPEPRTALEMTLLRMLAFRPQGVPKPAQTPLPMRGESGGREQRSQSESSSTPGRSAESDEPSPAPSVPVATEAAVPDERFQNGAAPAHGVPDSNEPSAPWSDSAYAESDYDESAYDAASYPPPDEDVDARASQHPPPWNDDTVGQAPRPVRESSAYAEAVVAELGVQAAPVPEQQAANVPPEAVQSGRAWPEEPRPGPAPAVGPGIVSPESHDEAEKVSASAEERSGPAASSASRQQDTISHAAWLTLFPRLGLSGMTGNLVAHCIVSHDDGSMLRLTLDPSQAAMNSDIHRERLETALEAAGYARRVLIEQGDIPDGIQTPKARRERELAERRARAVEALRHDPHIQELEQIFSARLLEQSVTSFEKDA